MHWSEKIAASLTAAHPQRDTFVCASGISPSGHVHIGNFREVATTWFVAQSLQKLGKKVRFIFSWDDYDRFRKVPSGLDPAFAQYIGLPYTEVPCPYGCHASYAEHYEREFEDVLAVFGITPEFIYQRREYRSGRYAAGILRALAVRREIYDILMDYKTGERSDEEREAYYPVHVYCERCGKDTTTVHAYDDESQNLVYSCTCGCYNTLHVPQAGNIKLQWKVDWPMRWGAEDVVFEPGGRDHSTANGSYCVASVIAERIFGRTPPMYEPYDFISIKGSYAKMSSSSGHNYTPDDLLQIYAPGNILFLFAKYQPSAAFSIGLDDDVLRNYMEYERCVEAYHGGSLQDSLRTAVELSMTARDGGQAPSFNQTAALLPLVNFDLKLTRELLERSGEHYSDAAFQAVVRRAGHWLQNWVPHKLVAVNGQPDRERYAQLTAEVQGWVQAFCRLLRAEPLPEAELMAAVYDICRVADPKISKQNHKQFFSTLYQLVLGQPEGPRIPLLVQAVGTRRLLALLDL
ncbi:lysine--tRNA ligase [Paenibacillus tengchongensis]|uniref:lysine--tRNA ligase n=1 Tax=Paenibacillus tengchongensis TaxID=2608684 RepID=UPI00124DB387|nr:lysine--tRNA ligase [Paenibacillus tengchongensis]